MQDRILHMFENQEEPHEVEDEGQSLLLAHNDVQQPPLDGFLAKEQKEKVRTYREMSPATKYVLRTNGLLQQRVMIQYALRQNSTCFEEAVAKNDVVEMRKYEQYIDGNHRDIAHYEEVIQEQLRLAEELGYVIEPNPITGRYVIVSGPSPEHKAPIVSLSTQARANIVEYFTALHEFESTALEFLQEEFKTAIAEGRYEQTAEFGKQMTEIKNRISIIEKHRDGLLKLFA